MSGSPTAQRLIGSSVVGVLAIAVNIVAALFLLPFLISRLGDQWYGAWVLIGTILGYFTVLDVGLFSAAERYVALHFARRDWSAVNTVLSTSLAVFSVVGIAALVCVSLATLAVPLFVDDAATRTTVQLAMLICAVDLALFFPSGTLNGIVVARLRYDIAGLLQIGKTLLRTGLIVYFIAAGYGIVALAAITLATNVLERGARLWISARLFPELDLSLRRFSRAHLREFIGYGVPSFLTEVSDKLRFYVDTVVVGAMLSVSAVTVYNIAVRLVHYYIQVIGGGVGYLLPVFTAQAGAGEMAALRRSFLFGTKIAVALSALVGGGLIGVGGPVIAVWIGAEYRAAVLPLVVLVAGVFFELAQTPSINLLYALGRQGFLARIGIVEALANLALSLLLVGEFGVLGVALGTTIPLVLLRAGVQPVFVCRQIDLPLATYLRSVARVAVPAIALQAPLWLLLADVGGAQPWLAIALAVVAWPVASLLLYFIAFDRAERDILWNAVGRWTWRRRDAGTAA
jgi:O-antigen/teichoic acid export membrane protein